VERIVADRVELEVARDHAVGLALDIQIVDGGEKPAGIDLLPDFGVID
jgi:hypothetical protein